MRCIHQTVPSFRFLNNVPRRVFRAHKGYFSPYTLAANGVASIILRLSRITGCFRLTTGYSCLNNFPAALPHLWIGSAKRVMSLSRSVGKRPE